ncbi:MAG: hypothetical protein WCI65_03890 [Synechococcaceae cyanobacterium ELA263]
MAYPSSHPVGSSPHSQGHNAQGHGGGSVANGAAGSSSLSQPGYRCHLQGGPQAEGDHQLEKLEFALAVALTRGDTHRSEVLRDQIAALGGNLEEPGT